MIVSEAFGNALLVYLYDESGSPIGLQYRTSSYAPNQFDTYYFEKNIFGDIVAVYTEAGVKIGSYTYDAWGNCTVTEVSSATALQKSIVRTYNPFRYRGYYYDTETGLYYLQSRYYNPQWGRFLNEDGLIYSQAGLIGYNMYAYCSNNPVMGYDPSGYADEDIKDDDIGHIKDPAPVYNGTGNMGYKGGSGTGGINGTVNNGATTSNPSTQVVKMPETKMPTQISSGDATSAWDNYLGPNQTNYNPYSGTYDPNRIFSADGTRSIRFGNHEMNSFGTSKAHFHYETWRYNPYTNIVEYYNIIQRMK